MVTSPPVEEVKRLAFMEEYKHCSCTFIGFDKADMPGYCEKHGHDKRRTYQITATESDAGYAHIG